MSLSPAGCLEGRDTPFTMNQVWLEPGYNVCTGYKGALGGKETFLGLWHPGTNRFSGDLPLSLGPELAFSASVQSSDTHQAGVALKSKGQQIHSVTTRQSWPKRGGGWEDVRALLFPEAGSWQQLSPLGGEACAGLRTEEFGRKAQNSWPFVLVSSKWETLKGVSILPSDPRPCRTPACLQGAW